MKKLGGMFDWYDSSRFKLGLFVVFLVYITLGFGPTVILLLTLLYLNK